MHFGYKNVEQPGIGYPRLVSSELIVNGHSAVLDNPLSGMKVPPQILIHTRRWFNRNARCDRKQTDQQHRVEKCFLECGSVRESLFGYLDNSDVNLVLFGRGSE
jgi:hypothetical protein